MQKAGCPKFCVSGVGFPGWAESPGILHPLPGLIPLKNTMSPLSSGEMNEGRGPIRVFPSLSASAVLSSRLPPPTQRTPADPTSAQGLGTGILPPVFPPWRNRGQEAAQPSEGLTAGPMQGWEVGFKTQKDARGEITSSPRRSHGRCLFPALAGVYVSPLPSPPLFPLFRPASGNSPGRRVARAGREECRGAWAALC